MKLCYKNEIKKICRKLSKEEFNLKFAVVADSHLDNSLPETLENIKAVDNEINFDFMLHLGDFLNGNIPKEYTEKIFKEQVELFENTINGKFFPTQGNHDGYTDFKYNDIATDGLWEYATGRKPYYFEDYKDFRIVSLCSFAYEYTPEGNFRKLYKILDSQIEWLENVALNTDKTVIFLSHDSPLTSLYEKGITPVIEAVLRAKEKYKFDIAGWFIGHFHGDYSFKAHGINFFVIASETAYVPQLWGFSEKEPEIYPERKLGTVSEDLWNVVTINTNTRKIKLMRFGAGKDEEISY